MRPDRAGYVSNSHSSGKDVGVNRRTRAAAAVLAACCAGCVSHPVGPARTYGKYEGKAVTTAEGVVSAVQTARMAAQTASKGNSFGPYIGTVASESEDAASGLQGTFDSIQPPDARADNLRTRLDKLIADAVTHLADLRVSLRRGELADATKTARPLRKDFKRLSAFVDEHKS
ncbi:MAG: hypothetical protein QOK28_968 [Actinomycetota bacterium]